MAIKYFIAPIDKCPHCGSDSGFYTKDYVCGSTRYYQRFDGTEEDNSEFYSPLEHRQGKYAYCSDCNKRIFKMNELEESQ
jgi:hypothetical protein